MSKKNSLEGKTIGLLCQYYPPEEGAAPERMRFFTHWLKKVGANVIIFTAMPNYPKGIIFEGYKGKIFLKEQTDTGFILRSWCYTSQDRSAKKRLINYFSFMIMSLRWLFSLRKCDVVIFSSGPMFAGFAAFLAKIIFNKKVILDARDLWPDRIWDTGAIKLPSLIVKLLYGYERFMYNNVVAITCVTEGVSRAIKSRLKKDIPVIVVRNCDQEITNSNTVNVKRELSGKIRIVEAGTIGWAQDPELLCNSYNMLDSNFKEKAELQFAGNGPRVEKLQNDIFDTKSNISYVGQLSKNEYWQFLAKSDIGVVTLQPNEHNAMTVSRRVYDYARSGLAIVYCGTGEGADIVHTTGAGLVVPPGDQKALTDVLQLLVSNPDELQKWKERGKRMLTGELSAKSVAEELIRTINRVL